MAVDATGATTRASSSSASPLDELVDPVCVVNIPAAISINHLQLRNLLLCPEYPHHHQHDPSSNITNHDHHHAHAHHHHGHHLLYTIHNQSILQHRISKSTCLTQEIAKLPFQPVCLALSSTPPSSSPGWLLVSGGQSAELHISLHSFTFSHRIWEHNFLIKKASINNSVLIIPGGEGKMRVLVSNNDCTVKFFEVDCHLNPHHNHNPPQSPSSSSQQERDGPIKEIDDRKGGGSERDGVRKVYEIRLDCAVNFATVDPDYTTLLSITDSHQIYVHALSPNAQPKQLTVLTLPFSSPTPSLSPPPNNPARPPHPFLNETGPFASFAAHFSEDGLKFAVGSQSGTVVVWDVRSEKPIWTYLTEYREDSPCIGGASSAYPQGRAKIAPSYGVRCLKFGHGVGRDLLAFTEHTHRVHIVDTRTFTHHQIIEIPPPPPPRLQSPTSSALPPISPTSPTTPTQMTMTSPSRPRPRPRRQSALLVGSGRPPPPPPPIQPTPPSNPPLLSRSDSLHDLLITTSPIPFPPSPQPPPTPTSTTPTMDLVGLSWSSDGDSLWVGSGESIVQWKVNLGAARGGWCEDGGWWEGEMVEGQWR